MVHDPGVTVMVYTLTLVVALIVVPAFVWQDAVKTVVLKSTAEVALPFVVVPIVWPFWSVTVQALVRAELQETRAVLLASIWVGLATMLTTAFAGVVEGDDALCKIGCGNGRGIGCAGV